MDELVILQKLSNIIKIANRLKYIRDGEARAQLGSQLHLEVLQVINTIDRKIPNIKERVH